MVELFREKIIDDGIPFWSNISKAVANGSKKSIFKLSYQQIAKLITDGEWMCECGKMVDYQPEAILSFFSQLCNEYVSVACDDCTLKYFDSGNMLMAEDGMLNDIKQIRKRQNFASNEQKERKENWD